MQVMGIGFLWKVSMLSLRDGLRNTVCIIRSQLSWFRHLTRMVAEHLLRKMFWACLTRGTLMKTQSSLFTYSQYHYFLFLKIHSIGIVFDSYVIIVSGCHWKVLFTHWWVKAVAAVRAVVLLIVILVTSFTSVLFCLFLSVWASLVLWDVARCMPWTDCWERLVSSKSSDASPKKTHRKSDQLLKVICVVYVHFMCICLNIHKCIYSE